MTKLSKIDSNATGLSYAEEDSLSVLPVTPIWKPLEPNGYSDFGGEITVIARNPINPSRQRKKGVVTDLNASGGWGTDLTQENFQDLIQGFMFADMRVKDELSIATTDTGDTTDDYEPAAGGDAYVVNDLLFAKGFSDNIANGLKVVGGVPGATSVPVTTALPALTGQTGTISKVGFEFAAGDVNIDTTGTLPAITSTVKDLTTLGLIPGELIFIGGDATIEQFAGATNNGFCRVSSVTANRMEFDETQAIMVTETGTGLTIRIFLGRLNRNELGSLIKRRSYSLERTLGAPDDASPAQIQAQYVDGAVANELSLNIPTAGKISMDLTFQGTKTVNNIASVGVRTGTRNTLIESDAFNTSDNVPFIKLSKVVPGDASPEPLFAFAQEITMTINNNLEANKAIGVLGAFEVTAGTFQVGGDLTAYFADIAAVQAVQDNIDISLQMHLVKANQGVSIQLPLITLGDGRPNVEQDQPITLPLSMDAASAAKISSTLDFTLQMTFWDYLPNLAEA